MPHFLNHRSHYDKKPGVNQKHDYMSVDMLHSFDISVVCVFFISIASYQFPLFYLIMSLLVLSLCVLLLLLLLSRSLFLSRSLSLPLSPPPSPFLSQFDFLSVSLISSLPLPHSPLSTSLPHALPLPSPNLPPLSSPAYSRADPADPIHRRCAVINCRRPFIL